MQKKWRRGCERPRVENELLAEYPVVIVAETDLATPLNRPKVALRHRRVFFPLIPDSVYRVVECQ